jgi:1,4-alpha-glucan branching enzyme
MHDFLHYMGLDPIFRRFHHNSITFSIMYAFAEHFVLVLSHDEVVHGKRSLLNKMPGDEWQQFANLRMFFAWMYGHPGKKLLFMGGEFGQRREWNHDRELDWELVDQPKHDGLRRLVQHLNYVYKTSLPSGTATIPTKDSSGSISTIPKIAWSHSCGARAPAELSSSP